MMLHPSPTAICASIPTNKPRTWKIIFGQREAVSYSIAWLGWKSLVYRMMIIFGKSSQGGPNEEILFSPKTLSAWRITQPRISWFCREREWSYTEPPHGAVLAVSSEPMGSSGHHFALLGFQFPDMHTRARGGPRSSLCWLRDVPSITGTAGVLNLSWRTPKFIRMTRSFPLSDKLFNSRKAPLAS